MLAFKCDRRKPRPPPYCRLLYFIAQRATAPSGTVWPPRPTSCKSRSVSIDARSGVVARPRHIDQIDAVSHLRDGRAVEHAVQCCGNIFRADAELARLVLQNFHLDDARRLHPVEHDVVEVRICSHDPRELLRKFFDLRQCRVRLGGIVRGARPAVRPQAISRKYLFRGNVAPQIGFELRLEPIALFNAALCDNDHLAKPGCWLSANRTKG